MQSALRKGHACDRTPCALRKPAILGAHLAIRNGARLIKPLLVIVCVALAIKLLADPENPLRLMIGL